MAKRNQMSYTVMISGLAMHGHGEEALRIYSMMLEEGLEPADVVYVGILSACSHAGLLDEGFEPYGCMPIEPNDVVWRSLLSACRVHCNLEIGEIASKHLFQLNSQNPGDYVILSNMYARAEKWPEVSKVQIQRFKPGAGIQLGRGREKNPQVCLARYVTSSMQKHLRDDSPDGVAAEI
ncbi:Detected protein of unknown function [Hibiscus syriacus]|uniref:Pentatricopeptide repeat-containing protein n=1 Tax=Hibiscus syriacus TaxID=106335 RepID=A0A6A3CFG2_HIBSY|nr:Detected protein of unknown function [Hibiscus syriacus]